MEFPGKLYSINPDVNGSFKSHESSNTAGAEANALRPEPVKPEPSIVRAATLPPNTGLEVAELGVISKDELQLVISMTSKMPSLSSSMSVKSGTASLSLSKQVNVFELILLV